MSDRPDWAKSPHCTSGAHCTRCRDVVLGKGFRADKAGRYAVPGDVADFACPHGRPWGYAPAVAVPPLPRWNEDEGPGVDVETRKAKAGGCCGAPRPVAAGGE